MGKNRKNTKKTDNKIKNILGFSKKKIIAIVGLVIILALAIYFGTSRRNPISNKLATTTEIDDNSYNQSRIMRVDLNKIKTINFDLGTCDVRIQRSNTNPYVEYTVLYRGEENSYDMEVSFNEGELKLKNKVVGKELYMKDKIPIVRIFLPMEGGLDEIKGKITAGDVKITDLEVKNFDLRLDSGNVSVDNAYFQGAISNGSGSINLNKAEINNTKLETTTGNINIVDSTLGNRLDFITQTGDIIVEADKTIDNYNVNAKLSVGNFILGNISYRNIKDGYSSENDGKYKISMRTKIGDIIFNRGEGATVDKEEYITNKSKSSTEEEEENKKETREESEEESEKEETSDSDTEDTETSEDEESSDDEGVDTEEENN
ncbi:Uncharacterised protein [Anaerococcus prevotii]|uniref:DUF4097 domain-containing protein n=2 Tax=Anaerococcus prevotii TaxID=33034 RepID=C7RE24_ANAPD|nr:DUF4097 family beta strand repeat-containing protein [Anaerococcus prevotii]ACV29437.1 hypothetical protein Apre_1414 [Anaerococcus prevotii DSM 20548]SUU95109.1 Uncharacterised protein [Anaerococcus prevotii]